MNYKFEPTDVVTAMYESLLQRSPDAEGLRHYASTLREGMALTELFQLFLASPEFRTLHPVESENSFALDNAPPLSIQTSLSATEHRSLWAHISEVWSGYGSTDPFWSVLTNEQWRSKNMNDSQVLDRFYSSGEHEVNRLDAWLNRNGVGAGQDKVCAEYGCGVGRITHALARRFRHVIAFDISEPHLNAAKKRLFERGIKNVDFVLVRDEAALTQIGGIDLFYSILVLQHNPPPVMIDVLKHAFSGLNEGGIAFFQVPTYMTDYTFSFENYWHSIAQEKAMEMHCLPQAAILALGRDRRVFPVETQPDWCVGQPDQWISTTFLMQKSSPIAA